MQEQSSLLREIHNEISIIRLTKNLQLSRSEIHVKISISFSSIYRIRRQNRNKFKYQILF